MRASIAAIALLVTTAGALLAPLVVPHGVGPAEPPTRAMDRRTGPPSASSAVASSADDAWTPLILSKGLEDAPGPTFLVRAQVGMQYDLARADRTFDFVAFKVESRSAELGDTLPMSGADQDLEPAALANDRSDGEEATGDGQSLDPATLLVAASQQNLALLGLAPVPGVAPPPAGPTTSQHGTSPAITANTFLEAPTSSGWVLQITWTVALASIGLLLGRFAGPYLAAALFSRFERGSVLLHERRARLHEAIQAEPGVSFNRLRERVCLAPGAAQHHLGLLEQHGLVRRVRYGNATLYYPAGPKPAHPASLHPTRRTILQRVGATPGLSAKDLAACLGQRVQSTWDHLRRLDAAGLLVGERVGRAVRWRLA